MEKRKLQRRHLIYYLRVFKQGNDELVGHLVDLTTEGIMLMSEKPMNEGETYAFQMHLPEEMTINKKLEFEAECMWTRNDVNPEFFVSGYRISSIDPNGTDIIDELISRFAFQDKANVM